MLIAVVAKLLLYVGATVVMGEATVRVRHIVPHEARDHRCDGPLLQFGWCAMCVSVALLFVKQAVDMEFATSLHAVRVVLTQTTWGRGWTVLATFVALGAALQVFQASVWMRAVAITGVAMSMGGLGHAAADETWPLLSRVNDALHVLGVGVWIGGLIFVSRATSENCADVWSRFSALATIAAPVVVLTGFVASFLRLSDASLGAIFASDYGRLLLLKIGLAVVVLAYGAAHRQCLIELGVPGQRSVRNELWFAFAVLVVTSVLTGSAPPSE